MFFSFICNVYWFLIKTNSNLQYINIKRAETILNFIINHKNDRVVGFTLSGQSPSDSPENEEFHVLSVKDEGSNRIKVVLIPYQTNLDYIYVRRIFHNAWADSSWVKYEYAKKSDLSDYLKISRMQLDVTLKSGAVDTYSIPLIIPDGYKVFSIVDAYSSGYNFMVANRYLDGAVIKVNVRNVSPTETTNTIHVHVLCVK